MAARFKRGAMMVIVFLLPVVLWLLIIAARFGGAEALAWPGRWVWFVKHGFSGFDGVQAIPMMGRFTAGALEWSRDALPVKLAELGFFLAPFIFTGSAMLAGRMARVSRVFWIYTLCAWGCILFLFAWFFGKSPTMWPQHAQPGMYLGVLFIVVFGASWLADLELQIRSLSRYVINAALVLGTAMIVLTNAELFPLIDEGAPGYSRLCVDPMAGVCVNGYH